MNSLHHLSLQQLHEGLRQQQFSARELTEYFLQRIQQYQHLNAFIYSDKQGALHQADQADQRLAQGNAPYLTGIPLAHKDIFCTQAMPTTCASKMLKDFVPPYDATVVSKLQQAGMVTLGKTNMDEFAMGSSNENSAFGACHNPWRNGFVPGGSSGGSAAAVAAGLAPVSTGTDTGGSIRQPAALCGISGLKPTYSRVSRWGMIAYASSLDQAGPMAYQVSDLAILLSAMAGFDAKDSTSSERPVEDYSAQLNQSLKGLKVGIPEAFIADQVNDGVAKALQATMDHLTKLGASITSIELPHAEIGLNAYYIIASAECSSNLSRYDGVRFGHRCTDPSDLHDLYCRSRSEGFGAEVKRRIMLGTYALSAGYYDAYYRQAQKIRHKVRQNYQQAFEAVDVILTPTTPEPAFAFGSLDPLAMYRADLFTVPVNLAGLPALSLPAGQLDGLPIGMQFTGNDFREAQLLNVGHQLQQVTDWHQMRPAMTI